MLPFILAIIQPVVRGVWHRHIAILVAFLVGIMTCQLGFAQARAPTRRPPTRPTSPTASEPREKPLPVDEEEPPPSREYKELTVDDSKDGPKKNFTSKVTPILTAGKFGDGEQKIFDEYYQNYALPRWSLVKDINDLPKERKELRLQIQKKSVSNSTAVHDHLNELVLESMKKLATGDFHPAVRINAMLMIGELNRVEATTSEKAEPLPEALKFLIAAAENAKFPDWLRVEAIVGILRHASLGIQEDESRVAVSAAMLRLAVADLPTGPTAAGCAWIRAQAIEILGVLGSLGQNDAVFNAMLKSVADDKLPSFVRCEAADSLGKLNYSSAAAIKPVETAIVLGDYASDVCKEELQFVKTKPATQVWRRQVLQRLSAVLSAIRGEDESRKGIASLAKDANQQAFVDGLQKAINEACKTLDDKNKEDKAMKAVVQDLQKSLKAWLEKKPK
jgi:hypothetical protein